jgi:hypothetical protein
MVTTTLRYLARDELWEREKPYAADFQIDKSLSHKPTNYITSDQPMSVTAIKLEDRFELDTHGFCTIKAKTSLKAEDALTQSEEVQSVYFSEIEAVLCRHFPEYIRWEPMEFVVSTVHTIDRES